MLIDTDPGSHATGKKSAKSKDKGRPPGAKTKERPIVEEEYNVDACKHCRHIGPPVNRRNKRTVEGTGTFAGRTYTAVTFWTANCGKCGGALSVMQRHYAD